MSSPRTPGTPRTPGLPPRLRAAILPAALVTVLLAGCSGPDPSEVGDPPPASAAGSSATTDDDRVATRPDREPGLVRVDGARSPLTEPATAAHLAGDPLVPGTDVPVRVDLTTTGEATGFDRLCTGGADVVDVVDSTRPITEAEWQRCRDLGTEVVQLEVAADATVLAIAAGSDVGADCLDVDQVAAVLGGADTLTSWSQVGAGLDDVPLRSAGPGPAAAPLRTLLRTVLGTAEPTLADVSAGYRVITDEAAATAYVAGSPADRLASTRDLPVAEARLAQVRLTLADALRTLTDARAAVRTALDEDVSLDVLRPAYAVRLAAVTVVRRLQAQAAGLVARVRQLQAVAARVSATTGTLGVFSHRFWRLQSAVLRPFEIATATGACVLPDAASVADGSYPLSHRLLLTTTSSSLERPEVAAYLADYLRQVPELARVTGAVALPAEALATQVASIEDGTSPVLTLDADAPTTPLETPVR